MYVLPKPNVRDEIQIFSTHMMQRNKGGTEANFFRKCCVEVDILKIWAYCNDVKYSSDLGDLNERTSRTIRTPPEELLGCELKVPKLRFLTKIRIFITCHKIRRVNGLRDPQKKF